MSPWLAIVILGTAIAGFAWMTPKAASKSGQEGFVSEEAYNELLENLEAENRELFDAVAKFKKEHDDKVEKLSRKVVDMESRMKRWAEKPVAEAANDADVRPSASRTVYPESEAAAVRSVALPDEQAVSREERLPAAEAPLESAAAEAAAEAEPELPPNSIRGRYAELLELHESGRSVEQICKTLGMNKGEVQLILQLARREGNPHA